ncbi:MAG: hypothetical protein QOG18_1068, partial [Microbacteriaceae bacterium]|nr:hypothetical protein [Microbacteriaceae bacterium]
MMFGVIGALALILTGCAPGSNASSNNNSATTAKPNASFSQAQFDLENS